MNCPNCKTQNQQGAKFCLNCGALLAPQVAQNHPTVLSTPPITPAPTFQATANNFTSSTSYVAPGVMSQAGSGMRYAGFWVRFGALLIDTIISIMVGIALGIIMGIVFYQSSAKDSIINIIGSIYGLIYSIGFLGAKGATPGKMILGIKVIHIDGSPVSYGTAALRETIGKIISTIPLFLGYFWVIWDSKKQGFHDKIAGTVVIHLH